MPSFFRRRSRSIGDVEKPKAWKLPALEPSPALAAAYDDKSVESRPALGKAPSQTGLQQFHRPSSSSVSVHKGGSYMRKSRSEHGHDENTIASLYSRDGILPSSPPVPTTPTASRRPRQAPPTLNLMVAGRRSSGKTSWLRTLLSQVELASGASKVESEERVAAFCSEDRPSATKAFMTCAIDIVTDLHDRVTLSITDVPGFEESTGLSTDEFVAEHQLSGLMRHLESSFQQALIQEQQVVRSTAKVQDSHTHAVIYFLTPRSLLKRTTTTTTTTTVNGLDTPPSSPPRQRTISRRSMSSPNLCSGKFEDDEEPKTNGVMETTTWALSPFDIRAIRRLSTRANVITVIGRSDELTAADLDAVRAAVKRGLRRERIGLGLLEPAIGTPRVDSTADEAPNGRTTPPNPEPIVLTRSPTTTRTRRAQSLSRRRRTLILEEDTTPPDADHLLDLFPFALVSPEKPGHATSRAFRVRK